MAGKDERIAALSKRFQTHVKEDESTTKVKRKSARTRHSLYLSKDIVEELDLAYKELSHELYPREISKSDYLEAALTFSLKHRDEVRETLLSQAE